MIGPWQVARRLALVVASIVAGLLLVAIFTTPADTPVTDQRAPDASAVPYQENQP